VFKGKGEAMKRIERRFNVAYRGLFRRSCELGYARTLEAIERLATEVSDFEGETDWSIGEGYEVTLDSLLIGAQQFCVDYHGGMWSDEYRLQCIISDFSTCTMDRDSSEFDAYIALAVAKTSKCWDDLVKEYDCDAE
jgi:hypothetical protein